MTTLFGITTILSAIMAAGSIEDCGGHCLGNDNWTMFAICTIAMLVSGYLTIYFQSKEQ